MTAINAKSDELSSEAARCGSGGWFCFGCIAPVSDAQEPGGGGGTSDPAGPNVSADPAAIPQNG